jgi:hypothetical protein
MQWLGAGKRPSSWVRNDGSSSEIQFRGFPDTGPVRRAGGRPARRIVKRWRPCWCGYKPRRLQRYAALHIRPIMRRAGYWVCYRSRCEVRRMEAELLRLIAVEIVLGDHRGQRCDRTGNRAHSAASHRSQRRASGS